MQADKATVERLLKTARGQIDGILKMVEDDRYCIDISNQILATVAMLNKTNREVIGAHIKKCVKDAKDDSERDEKIDELITLLNKLSK
ncbi:hypothetical protein lbkm_1903 [Lachnospiraceae bacterium KM106-2]|nr:hypothetical protein lbkm_1903 [Lachnospiraceae bacterium KM106-2]